ncbi:MAG TPA: methyltransferase domain-containing protein [Ramlibacter sp.]
MRRAFAGCLLGAVVSAHAQVIDEVPFITSPDNVTLEMLRLADVGPGDHVIDLGSGDGRIVILAARRFGATGLGVEIDPRLVRESQKNAREAGVADRVQFREQDLFHTDLSRASVVTMYLLPEVNLQLRPSVLALRPGTRIVSHDWDMGDWKPDVTTIVPVPDKQVGLEKSSRVHLWVVPARVEGLWCGQAGPLRLVQRHQEVEVRTETGAPTTGRLHGHVLHLDAEVAGARRFELAGDALRAGAAAPLLRARDSRC